MSFVSPALVAILGLVPNLSGQYSQVFPFGSPPIDILRKHVHLSFTIPGLENTFEFDFVVHDSLFAPIILGYDIRGRYNILAEGHIRLQYAWQDIPLMKHIVSPLDFVSDAIPPVVDTSLAMPEEFRAMLDSCKILASISTLPLQRPDDYRIRIQDK